MTDMKNLNQMQLDLLKELANIGVGNAVTSLSQMLQDRKITMSIPEVTVEALQDLPDLLGGAETPVAGVYLEAEGDISLVILCVLTLPSVENLIRFLIPGWAGEPDELSLSALKEVGNIITGSYLNAISFMTGLTFKPSPPSLSVDMAGAIIATVIAEARIVDDYLLLLRATLKTDKEEIKGNVLIMPDYGTLKKIFSLLGVN